LASTEQTGTSELIVEDLYTAYGRADVLSGVSLQVRPGEITAILGSNGAGKSTLIRSILGLTPARKGRIVFGGENLVGLATHEVVARGIACIPEGRKVFPKMSVFENLLAGAYRERERRAVSKRIEQVYAVFPRLRERARQFAGTMSGGEQAMLSMGRGLMANPKLLIIDEPSLGLSPLLVRENFAVIQRVNQTGVTILLVEQNVKQTLAIAQRGYVLSQGRVVAEGAADALRNDPEVQRAYFG
jgi:branched-chain amino acid transport system ATP-binding protein